MRYRAEHPSHGWLGQHWYVGKISPHTDEIPPVSKVRGELFSPLSDFETQLIDAKEGGKVAESYFTMEQKRLETPKVGVNTKPVKEDDGPIKKAPGVGKWELPNGEIFKGSKSDALKHLSELQNTNTEEVNTDNGNDV